MSGTGAAPKLAGLPFVAAHFARPESHEPQQCFVQHGVVVQLRCCGRRVFATAHSANEEKQASAALSMYLRTLATEMFIWIAISE